MHALMTFRLSSGNGFEILFASSIIHVEVTVKWQLKVVSQFSMYAPGTSVEFSTYCRVGKSAALLYIARHWLSNTLDEAPESVAHYESQLVTVL